MAAKISEEDQKLIDLFLASGIDEKRAKEAITNKNGKKNLESVILAVKTFESFECLNFLFYCFVLDVLD